MDSNFPYLALVLLVLFIIIIVYSIKKSKYHKVGTVNNKLEGEFGTPEKTLYLSTKLLTLHQSSTIVDDNDNIVYTSKSKLITLHDRTWIYDTNQKEVAYIYRKVLTLHERRIIQMANGTKFELSNELFHLVKDITNIEGLGWKLEGNIMALNFTIKDEEGKLLALIGQKVFSLHDKYSVDIYDVSKQDEIVTILISLQHMLLERAAAASGASAASSAAISSSNNSSH